MPGLLSDWPDSAGAHPQRLLQIEQLLGQLTTVATAPVAAGAVTVDASAAAHAQVPVTSGAAFTINAPSNAKKGREITVEVQNNSGGALGTITWDPAFKMAGAFTNPANGKRRTITYRYDGSAWIETNRASADI